MPLRGRKGSVMSPRAKKFIIRGALVALLMVLSMLSKAAMAAEDPTTPVLESAAAAPCVPVAEGVSYTYVHDANTASVTLTPVKGPRCEDVVVTMAGWQFLTKEWKWPQQVTEVQSVTLTKDATTSVTASVKATCQNDAYWGTGPTVGHINTAAATPWKEDFVNWHLPNGTGAGGIFQGWTTASEGPCTVVSSPSPSPTPTPTPPAPTASPTGDVAGPQVPAQPQAPPKGLPRPHTLPHTGK